MDQQQIERMLKKNDESSSSSSFVFQCCDTIFEDDEERMYPLIAPLCVASLYQEFADRFHVNYFGDLENDLLFLVSVRCLFFQSSDHLALVRAIIRTPTNNYEIKEKVDINHEQTMLQNLFAKAQLPPMQHYVVIHHIQANEKILEFDQLNDDQCGNKVAVIFQRNHQSNELEMLRNEMMSLEMQNFLELISERVQLKDFKRYRADLDTRTDQHGTQSYFTVFERHQIMFNVSTMIPSVEDDPQCIQRKSLVGNALICVIFQEKDAIFHPDMMLGKVTQIFITVQPMYHQTELYYKIGVWRRNDIEQVIDPPILISKHQSSFRRYFLTLLLNSMYTIFRKDYFYLRIMQQRQRLKHEHLCRLGELFDCYLKYPVPSIEDHINHDLHLSEKSLSKVSSSTRRRRLRLIPKLINAFGTSRPKSISFTSNSSINDSSTRTSPTNGDVSPWTSSSVNGGASQNTPSSLSSTPRTNKPNHYHGTVETQSVEVISSLIAQLPSSIGFNSEKTSSSTSL